MENGVPEAGPGPLLPKEQFETRFTEFEEPYLEYGVKCLPAATTSSSTATSNAPAAVADASILRASGRHRPPSHPRTERLGARPGSDLRRCPGSNRNRGRR